MCYPCRRSELSPMFPVAQAQDARQRTLTGSDPMPALHLSSELSLPADAFAGALAGRAWRPDRGGPSVVAIRADGVFDVSRAVPTMSDLCETENPAAALRAADGSAK